MEYVDIPENDNVCEIIESNALFVLEREFQVEKYQ